ncbi:MAG: type VII toxin-antitoxin system MntA family adenylyltransferase antitoxin [Acidimicrobiia bacterium]
MIDDLETFFAASTGVIAAFLFGSQVRGRSHAESDVDVGVLLDSEVFPEAVDRGRVRINMISELMGLLEKNEVDVVVLNDAPPGLAREVVTTGMRVFVANEDCTRDFIRDVQLRAADLDPFLDRVRRRSLEFLTR